LKNKAENCCDFADSGGGCGGGGGGGHSLFKVSLSFFYTGLLREVWGFNYSSAFIFFCECVPSYS
jgi:hypothetical protein